jgi:hypothetical protein
VTLASPCNIALTSNESLGSLRCEYTPDSLGSGVSRSGSTGQALAWEGKHDSEDGKDERQDKENGGRRNGPMMTVGGVFRAV